MHGALTFLCYTHRLNDYSEAHAATDEICPMTEETGAASIPEEGPDARLEHLRRAPSLQGSFLVDVLSSFVRTRSVNPGTSERGMADVVERWLRRRAIDTRRIEFASGRPSIGATVRGAHDGPAVILNGHMDTVPIDDESLWTVDPFGAEIRDGFLYGRGACDMKAGLAVQIGVADYLTTVDPAELHGSLVLHFAAGEERGEPGTRSLLDAGFTGDYGITTEPTSLRVATATRGVVVYSLLIKGRSVHASRPEAGANPVWALAPVLSLLREYDARVRARLHPLLHGGSCTPTMVRAGVKENSVPDQCEIYIDRRLLPGETADADREALLGLLAPVRAAEPGLDFELVTDYALEPAEIDPRNGFVERMLDAVRAVTGKTTEVWGAPFSSDVSNLVNDAGITAVTFGPGDTRYCHCADERVPIRELVDAAVTIAKVVTDLLRWEVAD